MGLGVKESGQPNVSIQSLTGLWERHSPPTPHHAMQLVTTKEHPAGIARFQPVRFVLNPAGSQPLDCSHRNLVTIMIEETE
jgi:hypothetical protein